jgi:hypothetical protein
LNADQVSKAIATRTISSTVAYIVEPDGAIVGEDEGKDPSFWENADWQQIEMAAGFIACSMSVAGDAEADHF